MTLTWQHPELLWLQVIFPVLLLLWLFVEKRRRSRIQLLGNPILMGLSLSPVSRSAAALLFALSTSAIAAVVAIPEPEEGPTTRTGAQIAVLLDVELRESGYFDPAVSIDVVDGYVRAIAQARPGVKISVHRGSQNSEILIPPTRDVEGLLLLLDGIRFSWTAKREPDLIRHAHYLLAAAEPSDGLEVLVLTPRSADNLAAEFSSLGPLESGRIVVVHMAPYSSIPAGGGSDAVTFIGGTDLDSLRELLHLSETHGIPPTRTPLGWTYVQILAAIGLLLLQVELMLRDVVPVSVAT